MTFPTWCFKNPHDDDITKRLSYKKNMQTDLFHSSGDFSYHITNIFFKTMQIVIEKVLSSFWIRIRKDQLRWTSYLQNMLSTSQTWNKYLKVTLDTSISSIYTFLLITYIKSRKIYFQRYAN